MTKKKIIVASDTLNFANEKEELDDISLRFTLSDQYLLVNIDLSMLNNGNLQRRKDLKAFKDFLLNTNKSISTKRGLYMSYKQMLIFFGSKFETKNNILKLLKEYSQQLIRKIVNKKLTPASYQTFRTHYRLIFTECYSVKNHEFLSVFPEYTKRTGKIDNATILDNRGNEKAFTEEQFKEISKIFLNLNSFFESLIEKNDNDIYKCVYKDIYSLNISLRKNDINRLKNKNTFCLMVVFFCLTGLNLTPLLRMKRSDLVIDRERKLISFKATCNRKNKIQSHNYPMRDNQLLFFEKIVSNSNQIFSEGDILFPYIIDSKKVNYFNKNINEFYRSFNNGFCGEYKGLVINSRKIRHSFGSQFKDIDLRAIALFNSNITAAKNYSTGNSDENNINLQNAMNIYTIALSASVDIESVKENIAKINIINIKDIKSLKKENSQMTTSGVFCVNSKQGHEAEKFSRKMATLKLDNIESIHCANILACFNCNNSILVNSFENIYLLKSFYNYLNNIVYESDTSNLFSDKNAVQNALMAIEIIIRSKIDKKIILKVDSYIEKNGNHPIWHIPGEHV